MAIKESRCQNKRAKFSSPRKAEGYFLSRSIPEWPFHFLVRGRRHEKDVIEKRGVKSQTVLQLTAPLQSDSNSAHSPPGYRSPSPMNATLLTLEGVISSNKRLREKYGDSHPWHHKYTFTIPTFSLKPQVDVYGISVSEWIDLDLRPSEEELRQIVSGAKFTRDTINTVFVNVGKYPCPEERRASATCIVEWESNGLRVELQVCAQIFFSIVREGDEVKISPISGADCYISSYKGFSMEVSEAQVKDIWALLAEPLHARSDEILLLERRKGLCIIGDFDTFEERKKPRVVEEEVGVISHSELDSEDDSSETSRSFVTLPDLDISFEDSILESESETDAGHATDAPAIPRIEGLREDDESADKPSMTFDLGVDARPQNGSSFFSSTMSVFRWLAYGWLWD